jgi:hypothetical protein
MITREEEEGDDDEKEDEEELDERMCNKISDESKVFSNTVYKASKFR